MRTLLLASCGGAIGAGLRFAITQWFAAQGWTGYPWATLLINVTGSGLMGAVVGAMLVRTDLPAELRIFLATGILGGYTTFSAFSLEVWQLFERGETSMAIAYVAGSVVLSLAALVAGLACVKWMMA